MNDISNKRQSSFTFHSLSVNDFSLSLFYLFRHSHISILLPQAFCHTHTQRNPFSFTYIYIMLFWIHFTRLIKYFVNTETWSRICCFHSNIIYSIISTFLHESNTICCTTLFKDNKSEKPSCIICLLYTSDAADE